LARTALRGVLALVLSFSRLSGFVMSRCVSAFAFSALAAGAVPAAAPRFF